MLKQLSDKLTKVFYQGPELKNMMETLDDFRRLAAKEEQQLKENDGKVKDNVMPKKWLYSYFFSYPFLMIPIILLCRL